MISQLTHLPVTQDARPVEPSLLIWDGYAEEANVFFGERYGFDWEFYPQSPDIWFRVSDTEKRQLCVGQLVMAREDGSIGTYQLHEVNEPTECMACEGTGTWYTECCSGARGCSCGGQVLNMGPCLCCGGSGLVTEGHNPDANIQSITGLSYIGSGPVEVGF